MTGLMGTVNTTLTSTMEEEAVTIPLLSNHNHTGSSALLSQPRQLMGHQLWRLSLQRTELLIMIT